jgi:hypothetical protein
MEQMQEFQFAPVQQVAGHQRVPGHPVPSSPQFGYMFIRVADEHSEATSSKLN